MYKQNWHSQYVYTMYKYSSHIMRMHLLDVIYYDGYRRKVRYS